MLKLDRQPIAGAREHAGWRGGSSGWRLVMVAAVQAVAVVVAVTMAALTMAE